jgi:tetratricopeptide (TPR) repeat protein
MKEAEGIFRKSYAANPKDSRVLVGLVETLAAQGHMDQAIQLLQTELAQGPTRNDLRIALGNLAVRAGNLDLAIDQFQTVLKQLDKNSKARGDVYMRLGLTLRTKGDLNGAIQALYSARAALPGNALVVDELALSLGKAGRKKEARDIYEQAIRQNPQDGMALNNLAFMMAEGGSVDLDQALTYAQRAKQVLPNLSEVSDTLGWIYLKKNMSDNAMDVFQTLVNQKPDNSTYRFHLGMAYAQKGDKPKALEALQKALRSGPSKDEENQIRDLINKLQA